VSGDPLVAGSGQACGGDGSRAYTYVVDSTGDAMTEFVVGINDLDATHYTNVLFPPGWNFAVEEVGVNHACGLVTPHGVVSAGPCGSLSPGQARWRAEDPQYAVELFTFGFDHPWHPHDAGWGVLTLGEGSPTDFAAFTEAWEAPVGEGSGPVHGPYLPASLDLEPETFVSDGGGEIQVPGYSVPSFTYWDADGLKDLIVGEGGDGYPGKVRVYPNVGTPSDPQFAGYFYAQSEGSDLTVPGEGCQGAFPRVVYWDEDGLKDLVIGMPDGTVKLFRNTGSDEEPSFDGGTLLQVGEPGSKTDISVFARATPTVVDWNSDGKKDLVIGSVDGLIRLFINEGTDTRPDFRSEQFAELGGEPLAVLATRSSPDVMDMDGDGRKDLVVGDREGQVLFYANTGTEAAPSFSQLSRVRAGSIPIDLVGLPRSRPFVCDWTGDGTLDVLVGAVDGKVHLYQRAVSPGDLDYDGDVDEDDYALFAPCMTGPEGGILTGCGSADLDDDVDVDLGDFSIFELHFDPPLVPHVGDFSHGDCEIPSGDRLGLCGEHVFQFTVEPGTLHVLHSNALYNCCLDDIVVSLTVEGTTLHLTEEEILTEPCPCVCCYDVESTVVGLAPGPYTVEYCWYDYETGQEQCHAEDIVVP
jgi:hypothetical protein